LKFEIPEAGAIQFGADRVLVGRVGELHIHKGSAAEVYAPRNVVPEQDGNEAGNAKDQRKGEKIPLFAEKIYVGIAKELHGFV
jgi:hypothetical protein